MFRSYYLLCQLSRYAHSCTTTTTTTITTTITTTTTTTNNFQAAACVCDTHSVQVTNGSFLDSKL
jgi:hypothetical protein